MPEEKPLPPEKQLPEPHDMQLPMTHYQLLRKPTFFEHYPWSRWLIVLSVIVFFAAFSVLYVQMAMLQVNENEGPSSKLIKKTPMPSSTLNIKTSLKTYKNETYNFSMQYPTSWQVSEKPMSGDFSLRKGITFPYARQITFSQITSNAIERPFDIIVIRNTKDYTLEQWEKEFFVPLVADPNTNLAEKAGDIRVGNLHAKKFTVFAFDSTQAVVVTIYKDYIYYITFYHENPNDPSFDQTKLLYNQVLSSFLFEDNRAQKDFFCGGIANIQCASGYQCKLDGTYPDAGGTCVMNNKVTDIPKSPNTTKPSVAVIEKAKQDLAQKLGIAAAQIETVNIVEVEWSDSSLGCPQAGMAYAEVITPGYQVQLLYNNKIYPYNTDKTSRVVYCDRPQYY